MSVIIETSKGDLVLDLYVDECPRAATNFLKLCKIKYYNNCLFYNVQRNFIAQSGDPTNTGKGGESVWGVLYGEQARFFEDEIHPNLKHMKRGLLGMAGAGKDMNGSQFYITTGEDLHSLDGKHTIFGEVAEGLDVLEAVDTAPCDDDGRPLQNIRIRHTIILDDPMPDPRGLEQHIPDASPQPQFADDGRLEDDWVPEEETRDLDEIERANREKEAHNRAVVLEMIGDLPEADAKPPPNMLFICKLNPVTTEEDLEIIFSRFGTITSCDIIRDWKTGDSLNYGFIGFDSEESCEQAYFKMNNVLIDDRRIKVDFSQSVSHLWKQFKRFGRKGNVADRELQRQSRNRDRQREEATMKRQKKPHREQRPERSRQHHHRKSRSKERRRSVERQRSRSRERWQRQECGKDRQRSRSRDHGG
ncbi:hypothetical protein CHLNCDRAFT_56335 [Chlorella variabilis]|uniref:Peptidyl-prolyl cis-trans isomerase n=1 Tax=Chlorella variabilis TaxID=554065 RepID=E1ZQ61_CHLVA|nr:hypothetical protein CHLNCDRAFT_56335 [Chlorella variabilis]EFN52100.1 hypothetical protein CHLNCDRAFT_56335 [Chlorella variabilis]|eukprot:XP_005844202.1 hypothetical protein CHLNCDRAFT_56335 [Chlorella variabilis]